MSSESKLIPCPSKEEVEAKLIKLRPADGHTLVDKFIVCWKDKRTLKSQKLTPKDVDLLFNVMDLNPPSFRPLEAKHKCVNHWLEQLKWNEELKERWLKSAKEELEDEMHVLRITTAKIERLKQKIASLSQ